MTMHPFSYFFFQLNVTREDLIAYNKSYAKLRGDVSVVQFKETLFYWFAVLRKNIRSLKRYCRSSS